MITEKAMLVKLQISQWTPTIVDKKVTDEIAVKYNLQDKDDRYVKTLIPKKAVINISRIVSEIRSFHYRHTLPWQDDSVRILATENFFDYRQGMADRKALFDTAVQDFINDYPKWIEYAKQTKKELFIPEQYPDVKDIPNNYKINVSFLPFPSTEDFRITLAGTDLDEIKEKTEQDIREALTGAWATLISRMQERLQLMYDAISDPTRVFRDNTITSVAETAEMAKKMNVVDDQQVSTTADAILTAVQDISIDKLRKDSKYREDMAKKIKSLLGLF
jgi:hypothetical protein